MQNYHHASKLQVEVFRYLIKNEGLNKDTYKKLMDEFKRLDKDKNGTLSVEELRAAFNNMLSTEQIAHIFECVDVNNNYVIDYTEFMMCVVDKQKLLK